MRAFPKPSEVRKKPEVVKVFPSGREVCNLNTKAGMDEYVHRVDVMFARQGKRCGLIISPQCKERNGKWPRNMICFGHFSSRGMGAGKRDDRIEVNGKPQSKALCPFCNIEQGSRPMSDFIDVP